MQKKVHSGTYHVSVCVCVCGGGGVNFEGENRNKADLIKGGNKVCPKYSKGGKELRICPGGIRFLISECIIKY